MQSALMLNLQLREITDFHLTNSFIYFLYIYLHFLCWFAIIRIVDILHRFSCSQCTITVIDSLIFCDIARVNMCVFVLYNLLKELFHPKIPIILPSWLLKFCNVNLHTFSYFVLGFIIWEVFKPTHYLLWKLVTWFERVTVYAVLN